METKPARMPLAMHVRSWTPSNHIDSAPAVSAPPLYGTAASCEFLNGRRKRCCTYAAARVVVTATLAAMPE